jgi:hypothetical protein
LLAIYTELYPKIRTWNQKLEAFTASEPRMTDWNELISDVVAGNWKDPPPARRPSCPSR